MGDGASRRSFWRPAPIALGVLSRSVLRIAVSGNSRNLMLECSAGTRPDRLQQDLVEPRNKAAHDGAFLSEAKANAAISVAAELAEQLYPLADLLP